MSRARDVAVAGVYAFFVYPLCLCPWLFCRACAFLAFGLCASTLLLLAPPSTADTQSRAWGGERKAVKKVWLAWLSLCARERHVACGLLAGGLAIRCNFFVLLFALEGPLVSGALRVGLALATALTAH